MAKDRAQRPVREPPSPLAPLARSFSPRRETSFFNPEVVTPTLTPGPGSEVSSLPIGSRPGPWVVTPPPPSRMEGEGAAGFFSKPGTWYQQTSRRNGVCSAVLSISVVALLFSIALGAYVLLMYLAVTTKKPKYIAFITILLAVLCFVLWNIYSGGQPSVDNMPRYMTEAEENAAVMRAYGKELPA